MEKLSPPRVAVIPFAYPDYPPLDIQRQIEQSLKMVEVSGVQVIPIPAVITSNDVPKALAMLRSLDFDLLLALLVSWTEAPLFVATLKPFFSKPILLWSHTIYSEDGVGLTLGALPAAGVLRETLEEMEAHFWFMYGMPGDPGLEKTVQTLARSASAVRTLSTSRVGLLGYASMGMYTGTIDHTQVRHQLGPEIDQMDQYEIVARFNGMAEDPPLASVPQAAGWQLGEKVVEKDLRRSFRMLEAIRSLAAERAWDALTVKCQYELSRTFGMAPCLALSILGDEVVTSCEGDLPLVLSQLLLHYLTNAPTSYGDLHNVTATHTLWGACGFAPLSYAHGKPLINKHTALYEGLLNSSPYKTGPVTLARLGARKGHFKLHIASGTAELPPPFHEVGCPTYPFVNVAMNGDILAFMQNISSQHYAIVYGNLITELQQVGRMLDIEVIVT
jgi:L-fucose isomerase-like protein